MGRIARFLSYCISLPKSIYFNFRCLPFVVAVKLPFYIHYNVKLGELHRGIIKINAPIERFMVKYGVGGVKGIAANRAQIFLEKGSVTFKGRASFAEGFSIRNNGSLVFGDSFGGGKNGFISCTKEVVFGNGILMAWDCTVRDSDGHIVLCDGVPQDPSKAINIGDHVWLAAESTVLKGVSIMRNSIVAYGSIVTKSFDMEGALVGGIPARLIKEGVNWEA